MEQVRVIIAVRVSSEDQKERGYGHANQIRRLPELVAEQGWAIAQRPDGTLGIYDEGAASTSAEDEGDDGLGLTTRPVLADLIRELPDVRPTYLVCRKLDRLHRNNLQWEYLQHKLLAAGVEAIVQFPALEGYPELRRIGSPRERAWASMEATWASLEKAELKEKLMAARRERAERGLPNGGYPAYGYMRPVPRRPLVVNEEEATVYLQIIEWVIKGHGPAWIANRLTKDGVPTRRSKKGWTATTVRKMLFNESQTGMIRTRFNGVDRWTPADGQPVIVERERWELARSVLDARSFGSGNRNARRHALAGILRCSACGATLKAQVTRKTNSAGIRKEWWNYTCKVYNSGCTQGYSISERRALAELDAHIRARLDATSEWVEPETGDDLAPVEERIEELATELADADRKVARAHAAWVDAEDDMAAIALEELHRRRETRRTIADRLDALRREHATALSRPADGDVDIAELRQLLAGWLDFPDDEKRAALEAVIDHAVLLPPGRGQRLQVVWSSGPGAG